MMPKAATVTIAAALLIGAAPSPRERVVSGDEVIVGRINDAPARIRIDPGALAMPIIDAGTASRARLHAGGLLGFGYAFHVGPTVITGPTAVGYIALGGPPMSRRIAWNEQRYQPDVDGVIGPGGLAESVVRFQLRPAMPGERTANFPLVADGGMVGGWGPSFASLDIGGVQLRMRFAPHTLRSYLSAGAALRAAEAFGGKLQGGTDELPIAFGITRPVRTMVLAKPLAVGPLQLRQVGVRLAEGTDLRAIPESNAPSASADPDEVVVVAKDKHKRHPNSLTLGADLLARCSSLVFDKPAKQVTLTCG